MPRCHQPHTITTHRIEWLLLASNITVCWNWWRAAADGIQIGWRQEARKTVSKPDFYFDRRRRPKLNIFSNYANWFEREEWIRPEDALMAFRWHKRLSPKQNKNQTSLTRTSAKKKTLINRSNKRRWHFMLIERHLEKTRSENPRSNRLPPDEWSACLPNFGCKTNGYLAAAHNCTFAIRTAHRAEARGPRIARSQMFANVT